MKRCTTCGQEKLEGEFYKDKRRIDGLKSQCKLCHCRTSILTRDKSKARLSNREYMRRAKERDPEKFLARGRANAAKLVVTERVLARRQLNNAVRRGDIRRPDVCSRCGDSCRPEGHHEDYSRPLDVEWLCSVCHGHEHQK